MIETYEELLKLHGRKVTCEIDIDKIKDARVSVRDDRIFICQNERCGLHCDNKMGYKYSWFVADETDRYIRNFNINLIDEEILTEAKPEPKPAMQEFSDLCQECKDILNTKLDSLPLKGVHNRLIKIKKALKEL